MMTFIYVCGGARAADRWAQIKGKTGAHCLNCFQRLHVPAAVQPMHVVKFREPVGPESATLS